jgi:hypothetical protein
MGLVSVFRPIKRPSAHVNAEQDGAPPVSFEQPSRRSLASAVTGEDLFY